MRELNPLLIATSQIDSSGNGASLPLANLLPALPIVQVFSPKYLRAVAAERLAILSLNKPLYQLTNHFAFRRLHRLTEAASINS